MRLAPLVLTLSVLSVAAALAAAPAQRPAPTAARTSAARAAAVRLPDSVLVRLPDEDITRRRFERAVRLLGGSPDSLTPASRDQFLELVIEQRLLATQAAASNLAWHREDSLVLESERDNVLVRAALAREFGRIEARRRALGQPDLDEQAMGIAARESLMAELAPVYDRELLKTVGSYFAELPQPTPDMSPQEQLRLTRVAPKVPLGDTNKVLVTTARFGAFRVSDLLRDWNRLTSVYRPHIKDDLMLQALVDNSLFERHIRTITEQPELAAQPEVAAVLADRLEYHAVSNWLQREVIEKMPGDSLTLKRYFEAHPKAFEAPARALLIVLTLDDARAADSLAKRFRTPGEAESLAMRAQQAGTQYTMAVTAADDSVLCAKAFAAGVGAVGGPYPIATGHRIFKVLGLESAHARPFSEARPTVERVWYEEESDRRIRARLDQLKRGARIVRNEAALRALVLPPPARHR